MIILSHVTIINTIDEAMEFFVNASIACNSIEVQYLHYESLRHLNIQEIGSFTMIIVDTCFKTNGISHNLRFFISIKLEKIEIWKAEVPKTEVN